MRKQVIEAEQLTEIFDFLNKGVEGAIIMATKLKEENHEKSQSVCLIAGQGHIIHQMLVQNLKRMPEVVELFQDAVDKAVEGDLNMSTMVEIAKTLHKLQEENPNEFNTVLSEIMGYGK